MELRHIEIAKLSVSPANMRRGRKAPDLTNILPSVRARGVLVPLVVRARPCPEPVEGDSPEASRSSRASAATTRRLPWRRPAQNDQDKAPDYRVTTAAGVEFGAGWSKSSREDRLYVSVKLDDPSLPAPVYATLSEGENGAHNLVWSR